MVCVVGKVCPSAGSSDSLYCLCPTQSALDGKANILDRDVAITKQMSGVGLEVYIDIGCIYMLA